MAKKKKDEEVPQAPVVAPVKMSEDGITRVVHLDMMPYEIAIDANNYTVEELVEIKEGKHVGGMRRAQKAFCSSMRTALDKIAFYQTNAAFDGQTVSIGKWIAKLDEVVGKLDKVLNEHRL